MHYPFPANDKELATVVRLAFTYHSMWSDNVTMWRRSMMEGLRKQLGLTLYKRFNLMMWAKNNLKLVWE